MRTTRRWKCASKRSEQVAYRMIALQRVPHGQLGVDNIAIAPAFLVASDVPLCLKAGHDVLNGSFGDAYFRCDLAGGASRVLRY